MQKAIFLDRDGVLNKTLIENDLPRSPNSLKELVLLPGVVDACFNLKKAGFKLIGITNQPEVARGNLSILVMEEMNKFLKELLAIDEFYACTHDDTSNCKCRKPKPGMLLSASIDFSINLAESYLIGDRWKDIAAGQSVGCTCYFIDNQYAEKRPIPPYRRVGSLLEATNAILEGK